MAKILIVEDDAAVAERIQKFLVFERHTADIFDKGEDALAQLSVTSYDAIIIDLGLPDIPGTEVCKQFRDKGGKTPILMLTGRTTVSDKAAGLDSGADDYLTKPFHPTELAARMRALLRRSAGFTAGHRGEILQAGNLTLDPRSFEVTRGGTKISLAPKEFQLLEFFMRHPNTFFKAETILERVWPSESYTAPDTLRTHLLRLRRKLDVKGKPPVIETVPGVGYKLTVSSSEGEER